MLIIFHCVGRSFSLDDKSRETKWLALMDYRYHGVYEMDFLKWNLFNEWSMIDCVVSGRLMHFKFANLLLVV